MKQYVCIHGHFYQPPRENPWLGEVEVQDSAYPFHDWNERISAECYAPNSAARILDKDRNIIDIVNNYARMSFNFGPTLLSWMERKEPEIYAALLEADKVSQNTFSGHGAAIAQAYSHMILPLANTQDKHTQIIWGIRDFFHRFKREPEGMWLPETAVDMESLEIMAQNGLRFTILSPHQVRRFRKIGRRDWVEVAGGKIDSKRPYAVRLPSGKSIILFFYDGSVSHEIAFGDLLKDGEVFVQRLLQTFSQDQGDVEIAHIATDGESYGHHHRFGDMALAYCLDKIQSSGSARLTVYGEYLERYPPEYEVEIVENSSWSCIHGVERWRSDCGCHTGQHPSWTQAWRRPLREAMDWLRDQASSLYVEEMPSGVKDPWAMRNGYIEVVLDRSKTNMESFFHAHKIPDLRHEDKITVLKLLELQRNAMLMYTSCGWFFDDISGIETVQVMRYAGRALQLVKEMTGKDLEPAYVAKIERAPCNHKAFDNGAQIYAQQVKPAVLDLLRIGVHYAVSSLFEEYPETTRIGAYTAQSQFSEVIESSSLKLAVGKAKLRSITTWEEETISYAVLFFGNQNLNGGARPFSDESAFALMQNEIKDTFLKGDIPNVIRLMDKHFGDHNYSLWHLLRDKKREVLNLILDSTIEEAEESLRHIFESHYSVMYALKENNIPLPRSFAAAMEFILNADYKRIMEEEELDLERLKKIIDEFKKWGMAPDKSLLGYLTSAKLSTMLGNLQTEPENLSMLQQVDNLLDTLKNFPIDLNLWKSQNVYFTLCQSLRQEMQEREKSGDPVAKRWMELMKTIGPHLSVQCL
jgi:alpha-amylase/alpha-mannosidase (GH57 family)